MDAREEIRSRLNIEDVVGDYVQLRRAGRNFKGLSPFSNERSPSFIVSPDKQIWHDFSSGKGGSMFDFIMEVEGVDFKGSLEILARRAGIDLSDYQKTKSPNNELKQKCYDALELAAKYYEFVLTKSKMPSDYLRVKRLFSIEIITKFRLGYAPNEFTGLINFLRQRNVSIEIMQASGLASKGARPVDMFRGRIMIPLMDNDGRVIGFTSRILDDSIKDSPKYLNTPATILYDKSRHIYGFNFAKEMIRKSRYAVIVEGNLDVIASHQVGQTNVVATAGTAMTPYHLAGLERLVADIRLAYDADKAGQNAAERAIELLKNQPNITLSMINLPEGKDPDELIKRDDGKTWLRVIEEPIDIIDWLTGKYQSEYDMDSAKGKKILFERISNVISNFSSEVEKKHYLDRLADMVGLDREAVGRATAIKNQTSEPLRKVKISHRANVTDNVQTKLRQLILGIALYHVQYRYFISQLPDNFWEGENEVALAQFLKQNPEANKNEIANLLKNIQDYVKMIIVKHEEVYKDNHPSEIEADMLSLIKRAFSVYAAKQKNELNLLMSDKTQDKNELMNQLKTILKEERKWEHLKNS